MRVTRRQMLAGLAAGACGAAGANVRRTAWGDGPPVPTRFPSVAAIRAGTPDAWQLVDLINEHRREQSLPAIPLSPRLTAVAYLHAKDLTERRPHETHGNLHSWSDDPRWRGGAYRSDDKATWPVMWEKPRELTGYPAHGLEIAAAKAKDLETAFRVWTESPAHHDVVLNRAIWADERWQWKALGAVYFRGFACAWFGNVLDESEGTSR